MTTWNLTGTEHHVLICNGSSCMRKGGEEVTQAVRDEIASLGIDSKIHTTRTRCNGRCKDACVVIVYPQGAWLNGMTPERGREMVRKLAEDELKCLQPFTTYEFRRGAMAPVDNNVTFAGISKT
ncbi:(2Fe-2S) ferredoxin domain-containing protein [Fictibacillus sp. Mic-4]|uniref:(2Fe-2S) ferredoxin domain-containing protein n=1 Tax=Fictibacillus TaxID=1329200 RepID=UPI00041144F2|nr:(2Fe-2S) ferredoxin domain-containing protein [Fictibacillus gelatini]